MQDMEEVFLLKKDTARMKEDTEEDIVLLKRDNARMRVELEQNQCESKCGFGSE